MIMNPVGFGAKNHCADEGQQQFIGLDLKQPELYSADVLVLKLRGSKCSFYTERLTLLPIQEKAKPRREQTSWSRISRYEEKNDCAGEDQHKFNRLID
jgi:hypothetical protein